MAFKIILLQIMIFTSFIHAIDYEFFTCNDTIFDNGGSGDYKNSSFDNYKIIPDTPNKVIQLFWEELNLYDDNDQIIYQTKVTPYLPGFTEVEEKKQANVY
jgi:hypothetical protein